MSVLPDTATQYGGLQQVLFRVYHFHNLSSEAAEAAVDGSSGASKQPDVDGAPPAATLRLQALDEKANFWVAFDRDGEARAVAVVEVKAFGKITPLVGVSVYVVAHIAAATEAAAEPYLDGAAPLQTTVADAVGRATHESKSARELLTEELRTALRGAGRGAGGAQELRRLAHMRCARRPGADVASALASVCHTSVHDDDVEWRVELAPQGGAAVPADPAARKHDLQPRGGTRLRGRRDELAKLGGGKPKRCLRFEAVEGDAAVLEPSLRTYGQRALRAANGVEVILFACIAAVEGRVTDACSQNKAGGVDPFALL